MLCVVFADIHGNLDALEAVLADMHDVDYEKAYCLGDIVGYGAEPGECIARAREVADACVAGNHEWATEGKLRLEFFNVYAKEAVLWTREHLAPEEREYISGLPVTESRDGITLAHGTLHSPESFGYVERLLDAQLSFEILETKVCFLGHSHVPVSFLLHEDGTISYTMSDEIDLSGMRKALINVGSVGQPRDLDPRGAYAIYDTEEDKAWIRRTEYDTEKAASKIREAGLPEILAARLALGR